MRLSVLLSLGLLPAGCLVEYVLPADPETDTGDAATSEATTEGAPTGGVTTGATGDAEASGNTGATGDVPTGSGTGDTPRPCEDDQLRCGEACIDPKRDQDHCGACDDPCNAEELCIVGECRDVLILDCEGCPCADQCPQEDEGVLQSSTGEAEGGGDVPAKHLCCDADGETPAVCVLGDAEDVLVCPGS